jgi:hypothetical protein
MQLIEPERAVPVLDEERINEWSLRRLGPPCGMPMNFSMAWNRRRARLKSSPEQTTSEISYSLCQSMIK